MRDPAASIQFEDAHVVRSLRQPLDAGHFLRSDLARRWVAERRLTDFESPDACTVRARRIQFVSHPFEWCDDQLYSAARLTLALQCEAVAGGYDMKDASAWNVVFDGGKPIFCDLLSFVPLTSRKWWAMGQYARHFVLALLISRRRGLHGYQSFAVWRDGVPATVARRLLGPSVYLTRHGPLLLGSSGFGTDESQRYTQSESLPAGAISAFRNSLHSAIEWMLAGAAPRPDAKYKRSDWMGYAYDRPHYDADSLTKKLSTVAKWLERTRPAWVADLGCNTGEFSKLAANMGAQVVALDADHDSVQRLFRGAADHLRIHPVVANLGDLCGGRGWAGNEHPGLMQRMSQKFDVVMMLALIHHLSIGAAIPLTALASFAHACTRHRLIVEFIDEHDVQLVSLCVQRQRSPSEFSIARQRAAFRDAGFEVEDEVQLFPVHRTLALLRRLAL